MSIRDKRVVTIPEIITKLPAVVRALPKILTAVYYNFTISPSTKASITDLWLNTVNKYPNRPCVLYQDKKWTYQEFNAWINRLANQFTEMGFRKGDVVAVLLENRPELLAISMAMAKIGGIAALVNTSQKHKSLAHSFNLAKPKAVLIGAELWENYSEIRTEVDHKASVVYLVAHDKIELPKVRGIKKFDREAKKFSFIEPRPSEAIYAHDPFVYIYTSGTTGMPKASVFSHGRWIKAYSAFGLASIRLEPEDVLYVPLPFFHATAMVVCWSSVVAGGASVVIKPKFSVSEFWNDVEKYQVTGFGYVGEMCKYLLNAPPHPKEKNNTLTKMIGNGLRPEIWSIFKERFGIEQVSEFYASSEGNIAFFNVFNLDNTMGFSIAGYAIVEYDKENERPVRDRKGFMKKVQTHGTGLLLGEISDRYPFDGYTEKGQTEKVIFRDVFKKGDAWFNSGDLVRDLGFSHTQFVDRLGDTFRWKGENVSTTEVEGIITRFPGISENIVYGVEIPGCSGRAGMVNLILEIPIKDFDLDGFYTYLSKELPPYAVPRFIRISPTTEITGTFKYKKSHLQEAGYDPSKTGKEVFALIHKKYNRITAKIFKDINCGTYSF
ncbi:MAG: hypothetical protein RJA25_583 [Bacteroidota bacterium]|jgi:citronellyl-CoA synthetase